MELCVKKLIHCMSWIMPLYAVCIVRRELEITFEGKRHMEDPGENGSTIY
jgi:hypothetical protein